MKTPKLHSQIRQFCIISVLFAFLFQSYSFAARTTANESEDANSAREIKKKTLSFEDELIEGGAQKPELFYLLQQKNFNYKRLIKLRENFLPEMRRTSEDIEKAGKTK